MATGQEKPGLFGNLGCRVTVGYEFSAEIVLCLVPECKLEPPHSSSLGILTPKTDFGICSFNSGLESTENFFEGPVF